MRNRLPSARKWDIIKGAAAADFYKRNHRLMYQLFCDSNCELWHTTAKEYGPHVIRMPYVLDGEEFY